MKKAPYIILILITSTLLLSLTTINTHTQQDNKELQASMAKGKELYIELCITCHLGNGKGTKGTVPPLAGADYILKNPQNAIYAQKFGLSGPIVVNGVKYDTPMPAPGIDDQEIADITNYIMNSWGNKGKIVRLKDVQAVKKQPLK